MTVYLGDKLVAGVATPSLDTRNIGQIVPSMLPLFDAGLHLLDGSLINGSGSYTEFVTYISGLVSSYPNLFITESDWQASVVNYGVCGKFVYDSTNNTVRLPKITGIIEGTVDTNALGDLVEAGLPNITGTVGRTFASNNSGAFYTVNSTGSAQGGSGGGVLHGFDASRSSSVFGNSDTVQPQTIKAYYYIVIANNTKTEIEVDIDEIATDLNGKADTDLSNATTSETFLDQLGPDWDGAIDYSNDTTVHTIPSAGYLVINAGRNTVSDTWSLRLSINGSVVATSQHTSAYMTVLNGMYRVNKNDTVQINETSVNDALMVFVYKFVPLKGAN